MFGFPETDRNVVRSYKSNYLRSVIFQCKYESNDDVINKREEIFLNLNQIFPRRQDNIAHGVKISFDSNSQTPIMLPAEEQDLGLELKSENGQKIITISKEATTLTISGKEYLNFESHKEELNAFTKIFDISGIKSVTRIAIRKINIIEFKIPSQLNLPPVSLAGNILNPQLLNDNSYFPSADQIQQSLYTVNYATQDYKLNLRYGTIVPDLNQKMGQIVIDIDLFNIKEKPISEYISTLDLINKEIFNIFNWALNKDSIDYLKISK